MSEPLKVVMSVHGNAIRITATQWAHVIEAHDYMAGNLDLVAETLAEPSRVVTGPGSTASRWRCEIIRRRTSAAKQPWLSIETFQMDS